MKEKLRTKLSKQIICIIVMIMLCNFIVPNYAYAADTNDGGKLFVDIAKFLCFVPDVVIEFLQHTFVSDEDLKIDYSENSSEYKIKYSPGTIFAGKIPAFDINFINPNNGNIKKAIKTFGRCW